jgi:hypothetical protein
MWVLKLFEHIELFLTRNGKFSYFTIGQIGLFFTIIISSLISLFIGTFVSVYWLFLIIPLSLLCFIYFCKLIDKDTDSKE